jgi:hypothetical protein
MVIVRSAFVNGGAIIPIRWSSDARRAQQQLLRTYSTQKSGQASPSAKVRARSFRVKPRDAEEILYEKALEATVSLAELVVCGEFEITQSLLKYDESSTPANTAFCGGRAKRWVAVTTTN